MKMIHIRFFHNVLLGTMFFMAVNCSSAKKIRYPENRIDNVNINYELLGNWAAHPLKKDPSDTIPEVLSQEPTQKKIDVFYIHPTTYTGKLEKGKENVQITDLEINEKTDKSAILFQASAFNVYGNVFAPRYRQAHIKMYQEKDTGFMYAKFDIAYEDVKKAFQTFIKQNQEKPFIIASHSQGTTHAKRLIRELIDGKPLQEKMVVAYLIGMPVEKNYFVSIASCEDSLDINCIVSWRTFRKDYEDTWANRMDTSIIVTNPITWKSTTEIAGKEMHHGAILYNMNKLYIGTHETQVEGSGLWISRPKFPGSFLYRTKNYHVGDINLFYNDIRINVKQRSKQYEKKRISLGYDLNQY